MSLVVPGIGYTTSLPFPPQVGGNGSNYPLAGERAPDLLERAQRIAAGQQRVPDERFGTDKRTRKDVPRPTGKPSPKRPTKIGETGPNKKTPRPSESPKRPTKIGPLPPDKKTPRPSESPKRPTRPGQVGPNKKPPSRPDKPFTK